MTIATPPEEQSVPGQAVTELSPEMPPLGPTRISAAWFGVVAAALVLVLLLIFILQNTRSVKITYFTVSGTIPLGCRSPLCSDRWFATCRSGGFTPNLATSSSIDPRGKVSAIQLALSGRRRYFAAAGIVIVGWRSNRTSESKRGTHR